MNLRRDRGYAIPEKPIKAIANRPAVISRSVRASKEAAETDLVRNLIRQAETTSGAERQQHLQTLKNVLTIFFGKAQESASETRNGRHENRQLRGHDDLRQTEADRLSIARRRLAAAPTGEKRR